MEATARCFYSASRRALYRVFVKPADARPHALLGCAVDAAPRGRLGVAGALAQRRHLYKARAPPRLDFRWRPPARDDAGEAEGGGSGGQAQAQAQAQDGGGAGRDDDGADAKPRAGRKPDRSYTTEADLQRLGRDRMPRDLEITDPLVMVIDDGPPQGPLPTSEVLEGLGRDRSLRMLQPFAPADAGAGRAEHQYALCKIVSRRGEYERMQLARADRQRGPPRATTKEVKVTWGISLNDLRPKLKRIGKFLDKGCRVEVVIFRKSGGRKTDVGEATAVVAAIREMVERRGFRELSEPTGQLLGCMTMVLAGKGS